MIVLGIESTAHTFGIGIIQKKNSSCTILANVKQSYTTESSGMIPSVVSQHHVDCFSAVLTTALHDAKVSIHDIDCIAYSQAPGIGHTLRIGAMVAKSLHVLTGKPVVGVNHCVAHLEIGRVMTGLKDPVLLYVSGANTQVIAYDEGKYRIFGETLDIGIGNFLDSFARVLGLGFPGGPKISELASKGSQYIELPYVVKGMDVSFGGLLTRLKTLYATGKYSKEDLCFSVQETIFAMMTEVSERAMAHCNKSELILGGGVACNTRLQDMCTKMCIDRKARVGILPASLNVDNGAMIAWTGALQYSSKKIKGKGLSLSQMTINPYERTDDVTVFWR